MDEQNGWWDIARNKGYFDNDYFSFIVYQDDNEGRVLYYFTSPNITQTSYADEYADNISHDEFVEIGKDMIEELIDEKPGVIKEYYDGHMSKIFDINSDWNDVSEAIRLLLNQDSDCYAFNTFESFVMGKWYFLLQLKNAPKTLLDLVGELDKLLVNTSFPMESRKYLFSTLIEVNPKDKKEFFIYLKILQKAAFLLEGYERFFISSDNDDVQSSVREMYFNAVMMYYIMNNYDIEEYNPFYGDDKQ